MVIFLKVIKKDRKRGISIHNEDLLCELADLIYSKVFEKRDSYEKDDLKNLLMILVNILQNKDYE